jgi:hypothetical protein
MMDPEHIPMEVGYGGFGLNVVDHIKKLGPISNFLLPSFLSFARPKERNKEKGGPLDAFFRQQGRKTMPETPRRRALAHLLGSELSGIYAAIGRKGGCAPHLGPVLWSLPIILKSGTWDLYCKHCQ